MTTLNTIAETAYDLGKQAKESAEELGRSAGRKLDEARVDTGDALHAAADTVRTTGRKGSEAIGSFAKTTADRLDATASYAQDHELEELVIGLRTFARRHLTGSLLTAAAAGFLAASFLRRLTDPPARKTT